MDSPQTGQATHSAPTLTPSLPLDDEAAALLAASPEPEPPSLAWTKNGDTLRDQWIRRRVPRVRAAGFNFNLSGGGGGEEDGERGGERGAAAPADEADQALPPGQHGRPRGSERWRRRAKRGWEWRWKCRARNWSGDRVAV